MNYKRRKLHQYKRDIKRAGNQIRGIGAFLVFLGIFGFIMGGLNTGGVVFLLFIIAVGLMDLFDFPPKKDNPNSVRNKMNEKITADLDRIDKEFDKTGDT